MQINFGQRWLAEERAAGIAKRPESFPPQFRLGL
jgi:hypothetical protein